MPKPGAMARAVLFLAALLAAFTGGHMKFAWGAKNSTDERFARQAQEINARYAQKVEREPQNAALYYEWASALDELAWRGMINYKSSGRSYHNISSMAGDLYAKAASLCPESAEYAAALAHARVGGIVRPPEAPGAPWAASREAFEQAKSSVTAALAFKPDSPTLLRAWAWELAKAADLPSTPAQDALDYLAEAEARLSALWTLNPGSGQGWLLAAQGQNAVFQACRESDPARQTALLGRAREFYEAAAQEKNSVAWLEWSQALDADKRSLTRPEFRQAILRERLAALRKYAAEPYAVGAAGDLCVTLEALAAFSENPGERRALLLEAEDSCAAALKKKKRINVPKVKAAQKRVKKALAGPPA